MLKRSTSLLGAALLCSLSAHSAFADQPIMNEVPRWDGGWGYQVFQEWRESNQLMNGNRELNNPDNLNYRKNITHIEGVYTWQKWIRLTMKIPLVTQARTVLDEQGNPARQSSSGNDDIKIALPLKYYINRPGSSGNLSFTPQIRFGGDDSGPYKISDGSTDFGTSFSWEHETANLVFAADYTYWWEQAAGKKNDWSLDTAVGWNFHQRGSLRWETEYRKDPNKYSWLGTGPTLAWNFDDTVIARIELKKAVRERTFYPAADGVGLTKGDTLRIGVGMVF